MLGGLSFSVAGGGTPCVHVRLSEVDTLQQLVATDDYRNLILDANERIFQEQIELYRLFFGTDRMDDACRWDFIEDYFTGMSVEELKQKYGEHDVTDGTTGPIEV